jgi:hypothetical protein
MVRYAKKRCPMSNLGGRRVASTAFSAEFQAVIEAGASTVNVPVPSVCLARVFGS